MADGNRLRTILVLLGLTLLIYLVYRIGPSLVLSILLQIGWHFPVLIIIHALYQGVRSAALSSCLLRIQLPYVDVLWIRISGEAVRVLTATGPLLAEPAKAWLLRKKGLEIQEAFASILGELILYNLTAAILSIVGFIYLVRQFPLQPSILVLTWGGVLLMGIFLVVALIAFSCRLYVFHFVFRQLSRLSFLKKSITPNLERIRQMEDLMFVLVQEYPARFWLIIALELAAQGLLLLELYWILAVLSFVPPLIYPLLIETASKFISLTSLLVPMQLGVAEGAYAYIVSLLGFPAAVGLTLSFIRRLRSFLVTAVGMLWLWGIRQR